MGSIKKFKGNRKVSPVARFSPEKVREIRQQVKGGKVSQSEVARREGVSQAAISNLVNRKNYKRVA